MEKLVLFNMQHHEFLTFKFVDMWGKAKYRK